MLKYGYPFLEFFQKYISSKAKTKQAVYTDILVTKSVKISAGRALLFAKAINEQTPNFSFCIFHRSWQFIFSPTKYCFRFSSLWLWNLTLDRSTWRLFNFVLISPLSVQWKAARCRFHFRPVMFRYVLTKVLRGVKALQTRKKSGNGFENLLLRGLASHSENF